MSACAGFRKLCACRRYETRDTHSRCIPIRTCSPLDIRLRKTRQRSTAVPISGFPILSDSQIAAESPELSKTHFFFGVRRICHYVARCSGFPSECSSHGRGNVPHICELKSLSVRASPPSLSRNAELLHVSDQRLQNETGTSRLHHRNQPPWWQANTSTGTWRSRPRCITS